MARLSPSYIDHLMKFYVIMVDNPLKASAGSISNAIAPDNHVRRDFGYGCHVRGQLTTTLFLPAGKGLTSWLSFVMSYCEVVTFPSVLWFSCGAWLYQFLIFALFLTL